MASSTDQGPGPALSKEDVETNPSDGSSPNPPVATAQRRDCEEYSQQLEAAITQALGLPSVSEFNRLFNLLCDAPVLEDEKDLEGWLTAIECRLRMRHMEWLIDDKISRPSATHPRVHEWRMFSKQVCDWLSQNVSPNIRARITRNKTIEYADEHIAAVKRTLRSPQTDLRRFGELSNIRREDFTSTVEFIEVYELRLHEIDKLGLPINSYYHAGVMAMQLQSSKDRLDQIIFDNVMNLFGAPVAERKRLCECFDVEAFSKLCWFIIDNARFWE